MIHSEATDNTNTGPRRHPTNLYSPTKISVRRRRGPRSLSLYFRRGWLKNDIDSDMDNVVILGDPPQNYGSSESIKFFRQTQISK